MGALSNVAPPVERESNFFEPNKTYVVQISQIKHKKSKAGNTNLIIETKVIKAEGLPVGTVRTQVIPESNTDDLLEFVNAASLAKVGEFADEGDIKPASLAAYAATSQPFAGLVLGVRTTGRKYNDKRTGEERTFTNFSWTALPESTIKDLI